MRPLSEANMTSRLGHTLRRRRAAAASGFSHAGSFRREAEMSTGSIRTARASRRVPAAAAAAIAVAPLECPTARTPSSPSASRKPFRSAPNVSQP